jgi:dTDP-4-dehydrorhamnose reductase
MEFHAKLPIWAGFECTVNRIGERWFDQLKLTGHHDRIEDLDLLKDLGVEAVRYPVLWERICPNDPTQFDWDWTDQRLDRLRQAGIEPIVSLLHHGSGPQYTSLLDHDFPKKFAYFARAVAERYPWVHFYTPINEPLTTAKFSCLYGHWYPHISSDRAFLEALLNQVKGTVLAMQQIRAVNRAASLVQTEDVGKTHSTPRIAYQAKFDNERRWITFDLLTGALTPAKLLWKFLRHMNFQEEELQWFLENNCPPQILGINYYVTSERFLDDHVQSYPRSVRGGNGRDTYADIEAVRANIPGISGCDTLVKEAFDRYGLPIAVTEAHLACTREEQMRWITEMYRSVSELRNTGVDVRALTAWSLLGAYDWDSLLTKNVNHYESGIYDVRSGKPRPTALTRVIKSLTDKGDHDHPCYQSEGWWKRSVRIEHPKPASQPSLRLKRPDPGIQPLLITGGRGTLANAFAKVCETRGLHYVLANRQEIDITNCDSICNALDMYHPWAVVNAAGYVLVDCAEQEQQKCMNTNGHGPHLLAQACEEIGAQLLTFSSDLVFDGVKRLPYVETDLTSPLGIYGRSKVLGEKLVTITSPSALVVRTSAFFGPWDEHNFIAKVVRTLSRKELFVATTEVVSPTYVPDLVNVSLDLLIDKEHGIWHLANDGEVSWPQFARMAALRFGFDPSMVLGVSSLPDEFTAKRPGYSALASIHGKLMPSLHDALDRFMRDLDVNLYNDAYSDKYLG